jgi:hypothetical protein
LIGIFKSEIAEDAVSLFDDRSIALNSHSWSGPKWPSSLGYSQAIEEMSVRPHSWYETAQANSLSQKTLILQIRSTASSSIFSLAPDSHKRFAETCRGKS